MAVDSLSLPRAELAALFLESLLFGAFGVLYSISIWILMYRNQNHAPSRVRMWMSATATAMLVLAITHLALDLARAVDGFIIRGGTPTGTVDFYSQLNHPTHVAKTVVYILQTLVGDTFVIYRLFIVWNRMYYITVLPILLLVGALISGFGLCYELRRLTGLDAIFSGNLAPWITSFFTLSLATNVLATILITGRIIWSNRRVRKYRAGAAAVTNGGVVETIVHSAAIYSAGLISLLGTYIADSNAQYICLDALQPLIGIVFALIIIRVGFSEKTSQLSRSVHAPNPGEPRFSTAPPPTRSPQLNAMPMAISVSVSRMHDRASFDAYDHKGMDDTRDIDVESGDTVIH